MSVRQLLRNKRSGVISVTPDATLGEACRLMMRNDIGGLPVVSPEGRPIGFIAEREIVRAADRNGGAIQHLSVRSSMRPLPLCSADDPLQEVMGRMTRDRLRHIVVTDGDAVAGIISVGDIVKHRLEQLEMETGVLRDYVTAQRALD
jgi:CBS domain-containing protein